MNTNNNDFNPDDFAPIPEELLATQEEQLVQYADEESVVDTTTKFLNIEGSEFGNQVFNALKEGHIDPIRTLLMIKKMNHIHDYFLGTDKGRTNTEAKEYLKDKINSEIGKETYRAYGAQISIEPIGGSTTMDYTGCGDIYLDKLYEMEKQLKGLIKDRQEFIKKVIPVESKTQLGVRGYKDTITKFPGITFYNIEPQVINISPPIKFQREGIVVRFVKKKK